MNRKFERREFLGMTAAPLLINKRPFGGDAEMQLGWARQKFRVGHNLTTYLSGERSPEGFWKGIEEISSVGVRGTEADDGPSRLSETYSASPLEVKRRLAKHGVQLVALYHSLPVGDASLYQENLERGMRVGKFLKAVGGEIFNLAGGRRPQPDPAAEFKAFAKLANELGRRLRDEYGLRLGYHPHTNTLVETREEVARMMDATNPEIFSLCPDTAHLRAGGSDPLEVFRAYRSRIIYMHCKDWDPELVTPQTAQSGRRGGFVELGKGVIDFPAITEFLLSAGYDGWVMIELDRSPTTPIDAVKHNLEYMTKKLGLKVA